MLMLSRESFMSLQIYSICFLVIMERMMVFWMAQEGRIILFTSQESLRLTPRFKILQMYFNCLYKCPPQFGKETYLFMSYGFFWKCCFELIELPSLLQI